MNVLYIMWWSTPNLFFCIWICSCPSTICWKNYFPFLFIKRFYLFLFLEGGEGRQKERERNINMWNIDLLPLTCPQLRTWPTTQAYALTGNRSGNLFVHRLVLNPLSHTSQGSFLFLKTNIFACFRLLAHFLMSSAVLLGSLALI